MDRDIHSLQHDSAVEHHITTHLPLPRMAQASQFTSRISTKYSITIDPMMSPEVRRGERCLTGSITGVFNASGMMQKTLQLSTLLAQP